MTKSRRRLVAIVTAVLLFAGTLTASALTLPLLPNPLFPPRPAEVPSEVPWPTDPPLPPVSDPDPEAILATLSAQIEAIAGVLGTTPEALLADVLATEAPDADSLTMTIEALLERLTGAQLPDETSAGLAGLPEIAIGNITHSYDLTRLVPAGTEPVRKCTGTLKACTLPSQIAPSPNLNHPSFAQYRYSQVTSSLLPAAPAASVPGTAIVTSLVLPLVLGMVPADAPPEVQALLGLIVPNAVLVSEPGGQLTNIRGGGWSTVASDGTKVLNGRHNGGTGVASGSNLDTAVRSDPTTADPASVDPNNPRSITDLLPIYLPLLTTSAAYPVPDSFNFSVNRLPDEAIDFVGFGRINPPTTLTPQTSCSNTGPGATPNTPSVTADGTQMVLWGAQNCRLRQSMSGFGIAIYNKSPLNFRTDLAPLWAPAPSSVAAVNTAVANVVTALQPMVPSQSALTVYALQLLGYAMGFAPEVPETPPVPAP